MKIRSLSTGVLIAALLVAIPMTTAWATHRSEAEEAIAAAKAAHAQAESAQVASPQTAAMIQEAEDLLPSRQYTKAATIATQARQQDEFAYAQAMSGQTAETDASLAAERAIAAAEEARQKAASVRGEWRDTAKLIKESEGLARAGKYAEAIELADKARRQGELGYEQALREQDAGFPAYLTRQP